MPQKVIKFKGIDLKTNEYQCSGECEELINLRPDISGGCRVVKTKDIVYGNIQYDGFYVHAFGDFNNHIAVVDGVVYWINSNEGPQKITDKFEGKNVSVVLAGNTLLVCCKDENDQEVFKFEKDKYSIYDVSIWPIKHSYVRMAFDTDNISESTSVSDDYSAAGFNKALLDAVSGFYRKYPEGLCGAAVVGCTYELEDGNEIWSTAFTVANVTRDKINYIDPVLDTNEQKAFVRGAKRATLELTFADVEAKGIRRVNIYATAPVFPFEVISTKKQTGSNVVVDTYEINEKSLDDLNLAGMLMYYQGSITPQNGKVTFNLKLGAEQLGESVMKVTHGLIERTGDAVSYNNRFHYYNSDANHVLQPPTLSLIETTGRVTNVSFWAAYVKINEKWKLIDNTHYKIIENTPNDFVYPLAGVKQLRFIRAQTDSSGNFSVLYNDVFTVDLKDSSAYNYSYAFGVTPEVVPLADDFYNEIEQSGQIWGRGFDRTVSLKKETNAINVSAQFNPFVFPVEYSYSFGGEIKDVATAYLPISSVQAGQYPLTVFTSNGIFALEQGNGSVLYGNVVPIQPHVIDGKATATPYGTFFISSKDLYILSGREAINVSSILKGTREYTVKELDSYRALCYNEGTNQDWLFDFRYLISDESEDFEVTIEDARLTYDQIQNELYISGNTRYSFVFNMNTKSYHKIANSYTASQNGSRYVIENNGTTKNVIDLDREVNGQMHILLQTRPMSLDVLNTHIQRLMLFVDANLYPEQYLFLSVFASDNLHDWKCIISSQKRDTVLRHIRTNKAAKSYKDYIILINGVVSTDTDLSDLIADYTVVNRRLG